MRAQLADLQEHFLLLHLLYTLMLHFHLASLPAGRDGVLLFYSYCYSPSSLSCQHLTK